MRTVFPNRITSSYYSAGDNDSWSGRSCAGGIIGRVSRSKNCTATYRTTSGDDDYYYYYDNCRS